MLRITLLCLLLLFMAAGTFAQMHSSSKTKKKKPAPFTGHEFMIGYGLIPTLKTSDYLIGTPGAVSVNYRYHFSDHISVGMAGTFSRRRFADNVQIQTVGARSYYYALTTLAPEAVYSYSGNRERILSVYCTLGVGVTRSVLKETYPNVSVKRDVYMNPGLYISPFGMRVGRKLAGFLELGIGYKGLANIGISYRPGQERYY